MNSGPLIDAMPSTLQQAGFSPVEYHGKTLAINELAGTSIVRLHSRPGAGNQASDSIHLPQDPGQCSGDNPSVLCLRPWEWLFLSQSADPADLLKQVKNILDPDYAAVYDLSDGLAVFRLSGKGVPWLLSKLSCLDYLAGTAAGAHCTRTKMGQAAVVVHYHPTEDGSFVFDLVFDRSIAKYLWDLLTASAPHADELELLYGVSQ